jgi:hypothetical protein
MGMLAVAALTGTRGPAVPVDIGPAPAWDAFASMAEVAIRSRLSDPDSSRFQWPYSYATGPNGYWTCGLLNSRNQMGGYTGDQWISVVVKNGAVVDVQFEEDVPGIIRSCNRSVRDGVIRQRN